jgi:hypothetical protein
MADPDKKRKKKNKKKGKQSKSQVMKQNQIVKININTGEKHHKRRKKNKESGGGKSSGANKARGEGPPPLNTHNIMMGRSMLQQRSDMNATASWTGTGSATGIRSNASTETTGGLRGSSHQQTLGPQPIGRLNVPHPAVPHVPVRASSPASTDNGMQVDINPTPNTRPSARPQSMAVDTPNTRPSARPQSMAVDTPSPAPPPTMPPILETREIIPPPVAPGDIAFGPQPMAPGALVLRPQLPQQTFPQQTLPFRFSFNSPAPSPSPNMQNLSSLGFNAFHLRQDIIDRSTRDDKHTPLRIMGDMEQISMRKQTPEKDDSEGSSVGSMFDDDDDDDDDNDFASRINMPELKPFPPFIETWSNPTPAPAPAPPPPDSPIDMHNSPMKTRKLDTPQTLRDRSPNNNGGNSPSELVPWRGRGGKSPAIVSPRPPYYPLVDGEDDSDDEVDDGLSGWVDAVDDKPDDSEGGGRASKATDASPVHYPQEPELEDGSGVRPQTLFVAPEANIRHVNRIKRNIGIISKSPVNQQNQISYDGVNITHQKKFKSQEVPLDTPEAKRSKRPNDIIAESPVNQEHQLSHAGKRITQEEKKTRMDESDDSSDDSPDLDNMNIKTLRAYIVTNNLRVGGRRIKAKSLEELRSKVALYYSKK